MRVRLPTLEIDPAALDELGERLHLGKRATRARLREYLVASVRVDAEELVQAGERRKQPELPLTDEATL